MSQRNSSQGPMRRRAAGHRVRRLLWTLAAVGGIGGLGLATAEALDRLTLPRTVTFAGHLKDTARTRMLMLPKGVAVQAVLLPVGARAVRGQTLVQFDPASIITAIAQVQDRMAADARLLTCLLAAAPIDPVPVAVPAGALQPLWPAAADCAQGAAPSDLAALEAADATLAERAALIDRRIKLEMAQMRAMATGRDAGARLVLGLAWEQARIARERSAIGQRRETVATDRAASLAQRIRVVGASLRRNQTDLAELTRFGQDPRLASPEDAIVVEIGQTVPGQVHDTATALIRIDPTGPQRFEVRLSVPASASVALRQDAAVTIELVGAAMRWPDLTGHVTGLEPDPTAADTLLAHIVLSPESATALAGISVVSGFVRDGSAIAVQAVLPEQPLGAALITAWAEAASGRSPPLR